MKRVVRKECRVEVTMVELIKLFQKEKWLPQGDINVSEYSIEKTSDYVNNQERTLVIRFDTEESIQVSEE